MKKQNNQVRAARRLALGGLFVAAAGVTVLFTASASRAEHTPRSERSPVRAQMQDSTQLAVLLERVRGSDPLVCKFVTRALENRWGGGGPTDILEPENADAAVFNWVMSAPMTPELVPPLRRALRSEDECVQRVAAQLLGRSRVDDLADVLRDELATANARTRVAALRAIGYHGQAASVNAATAALKDVDEDVRVTAIWALGRIDSHDAIPALTTLLADDRSPRIRRAAAWALGRIAG